MILEVHICTIGEGIEKVAKQFLAPRNDVRYLVSWQIDNPMTAVKVQMMETFKREDVRLFTIQGKGLSRNRNNALMRAEGDIILISDDDCTFSNKQFDDIINTYNENGNKADIILFKASSNGEDLKSYPSTTTGYNQAMRHKGYYPSSVEMTMKIDCAKALRFNENFGIGCNKYISGEESVFLKDAEKAHKRIIFVPKTIVDTPKATTGKQFLDNPEVQRAKGATFRYCYPPLEAFLRCVKESLHFWIFDGKNPFTILNNMLRS